MSVKRTQFTFFKNHPINDYSNTIHFDSNALRDAWHLEENHVTRLTYSINFNFVRDRGILKVPQSTYSYNDLVGVNYCTFVSQFEPTTRYYAFVDGIEYTNDSVITLNILIDPVMTFTQGDVLSNILGVTVERQHLPRTIYNQFLLYLRTNDDIIKTHTKRYVRQDLYYLKDLWVIFTCAQDLESPFGDVTDPILTTAKGQTYDRIISPLNIYLCNTTYFTSIMDYLKDYPYKTQSIKKVLMIPSDFINMDDVEDAKLNNLTNEGLKKFKDNTTSGVQVTTIPELSKTYDEMFEWHELDIEEDKHLFRSEYTTIEYYSWDGKSMLLDPAFLPSLIASGNNATTIALQTCIGYHNEMAFFQLEYKSNPTKENNLSSEGWPIAKGSYLNDAIIFDSFDEIPVLVDSGLLATANSANQRRLNDERQISNRINTVFDSESSLQDRFFNAASVLSGGLKPSSILGKFSDEYEYYRTQMAELADLALQAPSVGQQSNNSSFSIKNQNYGVTLKIASPNQLEWTKIKRYYKGFGYDTALEGLQTYNIHSMSICNYLKFHGTWVIPNVDANLMEQLKITLESGVRFYHNDGSDNPLKQRIYENKIISDN